MGDTKKPKYDRTREVLKLLQDGIQSLFTSGRYDEYLRFLSRFHSYSAGNCLLIWAQHPGASLVASYSDWKKQNRWVKKGERAIHIIAPHTYIEKGADGKDVTRLGFHAARCFDVSQTASPSGEALPEICRVLDSPVADFGRVIDVITALSPVPVDYEDTGSEALGYFSPADCRIVIRPDLSEAQTVKTLLHEIAHAWLHGKNGEAADADRRTREVQAESIAYVVSEYLGLDTSDYSFGYIAGWSSDKKLPELRASLELIRSTADAMIVQLDEKLTGAAYDAA